MTNVDYRFTTTEEGSLVFRSTVKSFGLDGVTDKDISSFYTKFSSYAYTDTGLLPVNNTGLLSVRSAGNHMQVAYQYEPGMYRINWGAYEGDDAAQAYYVAQPYRIVIGDFLDGNFLGARIFYTVEPVTHPGVQLYHVNLPNINCRGYRGNGVGWTCLYRNHDVTSYPFNEKLLYLLERCSGVEAYNDANMSETDGPRFYRSHYKDNLEYSYLWNPSDWQTKSENEGHLWTIDPELWIPIKVKGIDDQKEHCQDGINFTFYEAILGNYSAYYDDKYLPKPINALAREDLTFDVNKIFDWFKISYNSSQTDFNKVDNLNVSTTLKIEHVESPTIKPHVSIQEDQVPDWTCDSCGAGHYEDDEYYIVHENYVCENCSHKFVFSDWEDQYIWIEESVYCNSSSSYYTAKSSDYVIHTCPNCQSTHVYNTLHPTLLNLYTLTGKDLDDPFTACCSDCLNSIMDQDDDDTLPYTSDDCYLCSASVPIFVGVDLKDPLSINQPNLVISNAFPESSHSPTCYSVACNFHVCELEPFYKNNLQFDFDLGKKNLGLCICGKKSEVSDFVSAANPDLPWATNWLHFKFQQLQSINNDNIDKIVSNTHPNYSYRDNLSSHEIYGRVHLNKICKDCSEPNDYWTLDHDQRLSHFQNLITHDMQKDDVNNISFYGFKVYIESITLNVNEL